MADLSTGSTYFYSVVGNRRIVTIDVTSAGGSTSDTVSLKHLQAVSYITAQYRSTGTLFDAALTSRGSIGLEVNSTASPNTVKVVRSSDGLALPITIRAEGR